MTLWHFISYGVALAYLACLIAMRRSWMAPWLNFAALYLLAEVIFQAMWTETYRSKAVWVRGYMTVLAALRIAMAVEAVLAMFYPARKGYKSLRIAFGLGLGAVVWGICLIDSSPYPGFPEMLRIFRMGSNIGACLLCGGTLLITWAYRMPLQARRCFSSHAGFVCLFLVWKILPLAARPSSLSEWKEFDCVMLVGQGIVLLAWGAMFRKHYARSGPLALSDCRSLTASCS